MCTWISWTREIRNSEQGFPISNMGAESFAQCEGMERVPKWVGISSTWCGAPPSCLLAPAQNDVISRPCGPNSARSPNPTVLWVGGGVRFPSALSVCFVNGNWTLGVFVVCHYSFAITLLFPRLPCGGMVWFVSQFVLSRGIWEGHEWLTFLIAVCFSMCVTMDNSL